MLETIAISSYLKLSIPSGTLKACVGSLLTAAHIINSHYFLQLVGRGGILWGPKRAIGG